VSPAKKVQAKVMLVGAGPGAADLLTLRAYQALQAADIVLYDALVSDEILGLIPHKVRKISVGKRGHKRTISQDFTNALMVKLAKSGHLVVRLKGGDPSVFGRASEERAYLEAQGVAVEVVPGITTASAAAAQFGFSLTSRGIGRKVLFATGHTLAGRAENWVGQACEPDTTLCLYMAHHDMAAIGADLMAGGLGADTPALVMSGVSRTNTQMIQTHLGDLGAACAAIDTNDPIFIVIGAVCAQARPQEFIDELDLLAKFPPVEGRLAC
jgi:uroporphyrin-III C-methyltransferase